MRDARKDIPFLLAHAGVDCNGWEVALAEELVELSGTHGTLDEDDDLVELEVVQELIQLAVLLLLLQLDVVLLETVESELGVLVNVVLRGVLHELPADRLDVLRQGSREHHDLLLRGGGAENVLHIGSHV